MTKKLDRAKAKAFDVLQRAVRKKCRDDCCVGDIPSWKHCTCEKTCPLWKYRLGGMEEAYGLGKSKKNPRNSFVKTAVDLKLGVSERGDEVKDVQQSEGGIG